MRDLVALAGLATNLLLTKPVLIAVFFAVRLIQRRESPFMSGLKPVSSETILPLSSTINAEQRVTSPPLYSPAFACASRREDPAKNSGVRRRGESEQGWTEGPELLYNGTTERGEADTLEKMEVK